ncbi:mechanosensitive ion channel family protein [Clostridium aminobutyricum]|uniref:Mechanosensitive ion channel family protein n=1 Tax=Clostridium aminobutyricum TaxID=33953 RepID=A0A939IIV1_CLOAM|nr:mechanosensitive ion channel family protein [Clostridium aminobutyricum]MBN7772904.1 mechanosensitive ion channel family protein [Clostridium aminobutyricum]
MSEKAMNNLMDMGVKFGEALLVLIIGYILIKIALAVTRRALSKTPLDEALHTFIQNSIKVILWGLLLLTVLSALDVKISAFIAVLGAMGAAVALALKDSLGNIAGGIIILVTKPFKKGDFIDITEVAGMVEEIDLLYTMLKTADNKVISVPNGKITTAVMINYSTEELRRVDCQFNIGYKDDMAHAKDVLLAVAKSNGDILSEPESFVGVAGQTESGVRIDLRVWCKNEKYWDVKYFLEENVKSAFDEAGISIPQSLYLVTKNN